MAHAHYRISHPAHVILHPASCNPNNAAPRRRRLCNPKMPRLLSLLLGDKVSLVALRKDQAVGIREEYHAFRNRAVGIMGTVPLLLYSGMKRADHVSVEGGKDSISLTPALLTGGWLRGEGQEAAEEGSGGDGVEEAGVQVQPVQPGGRRPAVVSSCVWRLGLACAPKQLVGASAI